jgi:hypothetical protein
MTYLEALTAATNYPVNQLKLQKILIDRGITDTDNYQGPTREFELATADLYVLLVTSVAVSEGDFSVEDTDKASLTTLAGNILTKYGIESPLKQPVEVKTKPVIRNRSN